MRYVEYIYLTAAGMILIFLVTEHSNLDITTFAALLITVIACLIMFFFRRKQRIIKEKQLEQEMEQLKNDLKDFH